jgi:Superinfection immunity protein
VQSSSQAAMNGNAIELVLLAIVFVIIGIIYILPSIVAFQRNHPNRWLILVINLAFGGTIVGWGIALAWATRAIHRLGAAGSGGESGLNVFINDVKRIQVVDPPALSQTSTAQEMERLHSLLLRGAISQVEFEGLKAKLLE